MAYFKVNNVDFSKFVSSLKITLKHNYSAQTNANGDTVVDYINSKRTIEVEIIPLEEVDLRVVVNALAFTNSVEYRDSQTGSLTNAVNCIIGNQDIDYYTIQQQMVRYKKFKLKFQEL